MPWGAPRNLQQREALFLLVKAKKKKSPPVICRWRLREKGNKHFAAREYTEAISCYERGLLAVDRVAFTDDNEETAKKQQLLPLLLNLSACLLQLRQFARTKALCDIALKIDPQSCKALYRRATASKELGDLRGAQRDFRYILKICELQQQKQQQQQQQVEPHKAKEQRREGSPNKDLHPAAAAEEELQQVQRSLTAIPKDNQSAAASPASLQQDACGSPAAAAAAAGGWCLSQTARQQLVLQCRRQLASVSRQQQQYTAACARMFSVQQQQQQQQQQGRRQQLAGRPLGEEGGRLLSYACLYAWRRWMDFCCLCKQRKQRTPCSSS
ncbi:hypothetical protein Efla_006798 [Eimeria flavescens]